MTSKQFLPATGQINSFSLKINRTDFMSVLSLASLFGLSLALLEV